MKEFDSIRIVDKGGDSLSFEMTGNVAGSPYNTIVFLLRATSGLIAASAKEDADPQKVADEERCQHSGGNAALDQEEFERRSQNGVLPRFYVYMARARQLRLRICCEGPRLRRNPNRQPEFFKVRR